MPTTVFPTSGGAAETVRLEGPEIIRVFVQGGDCDGRLGGLCVTKHALDPDHWKADST